MSLSVYRALLILIGGGFALAFAVFVVPALLETGDVVGAFAAGFVNPFASGYALDAIACWCVLTVWVIYESKAKGVKHGWVAVLLGVAPGVATGFAAYLLIRMHQNHPTLDDSAG
ncbi:MAG: DUF2834 domain-containing protein [Oceanococcus sp.]